MRLTFLMPFIIVCVSIQVIAGPSLPCEIHEKDLKKYRGCSDGILLRLAHCYAKEAEWKKAAPLFQQLLTKPLYGQKLDTLYVPTLYWLQNGENEWLGFIEAVLAIKPASLDTFQRERLAEIWAAFLNSPKAKNHASLAENALYQLYVDLPETKAFEKIAHEDIGRNWILARSNTDRLARSRVLMSLNRNDEVIATLQGLSVLNIDMSQKDTEICEAHYLLGKSFRNKRQYQEANQYLHRAMKNCDGDVKRNAFFIASRLAAMQPSDESLLLLDQFLETYPSHSFSDDVSIWRITVLDKIKGVDEVEKAYQVLLEKYPDGDMVQDAIFRQAFFYASQMNFPRALEILKSALENPATPVPDLRATYWYGRFLLYPSFSEWQENPNKAQWEEGLRLLNLFAAKYPQTYYGYLAGRIIDKVGKTKHRRELKEKKINKIVFKNTDLKKNRDFEQLSCLMKAGYVDEAMLHLEKLYQEKTSVEDRIVLAQVSKEMGREDKSHQIMRQSGMAFPFAYDIQMQVLPWQLAFPKAYEKEIQQAALQAHMPVSLLFALAREESAFDKNALSWAGARGLCQLMPSLAFEQASKLKIKISSVDALYLPEINARLAADYFVQQLKVLEHPLLAIAAYNGGIANVKKWISNLQTGSFPVDIFVEQIPFEQTRNYVKKVASAWITYAWLDNATKQIQIPLILRKL